MLDGTHILSFPDVLPGIQACPARRAPLVSSASPVALISEPVLAVTVMDTPAHVIQSAGIAW